MNDWTAREKRAFFNQVCDIESLRGEAAQSLSAGIKWGCMAGGCATIALLAAFVLQSHAVTLAAVLGLHYAAIRSAWLTAWGRGLRGSSNLSIGALVTAYGVKLSMQGAKVLIDSGAGTPVTLDELAPQWSDALSPLIDGTSAARRA